MRSNRRRVRLLVAVGLAVAIGGVASALLADRVIVSFRAATGEVDPSHDLRVGFAGPRNDRCDDSSDGPIFGDLTDLEFDIVAQDRIDARTAPIDLCLVNVGPVPTRVNLDWSLIDDGEAGFCTRTEQEFGGDRSCGPGDSGELATLVDEWSVTIEASCTDGPTPPLELGLVGTLDLRGAFPVGASCALLRLVPTLSDLTVEEAFLIQTDRARVQILVRGLDVEEPPAP